MTINATSARFASKPRRRAPLRHLHQKRGFEIQQIRRTAGAPSPLAEPVSAAP